MRSSGTVIDFKFSVWESSCLRLKRVLSGTSSSDCREYPMKEKAISNRWAIAVVDLFFTALYSVGSGRREQVVKRGVANFYKRCGVKGRRGWWNTFFGTGETFGSWLLTGVVMEWGWSIEVDMPWTAGRLSCHPRQRCSGGEAAVKRRRWLPPGRPAMRRLIKSSVEKSSDYINSFWRKVSCFGESEESEKRTVCQAFIFRFCRRRRALGHLWASWLVTFKVMGIICKYIIARN